MATEPINLDDNNDIFSQAADFIRQTDRNVFLTGKAGTGKTTFLKHIRRTTEKNMVVLAPTGVAAINAGGQTVHSFFQIDRGIYIPDDVRLRKKAPKDAADRRIISDYFHYNREKTELIKSLELLVIDEISMLRCDLLDVIDKVLRYVRNWDSEPFGGVQMLLIGDTFQLPPIVSGDDWKILENYYDSPFFFSAQVVTANPLLYIELKKVYRQQDPRFIELLNNIRTNSMTGGDMELLQSRFLPAFQPDDALPYITLASHNRIVDDINRTKLAKLPSEEKTFEATVTGVFPEEIMPANYMLHLKEGAQVIFVKNELPRYYNGMMGTVRQILEDGLLVTVPDGETLTVNMTEWVNIRYSWNRRENKIDEEIVGTFTQYPLKLAWAITVHKSQGLTFDRVIADVGSAFTYGQVYVALSRCSNPEGLILRSRIGRESIRTNPQALFYARNAIPDAQLPQMLEEAKAEFAAVKTNPALPANEPDMTVENVFEKMDDYFGDTDLNIVALSDKLTALLAENTTSFAKKIKALEWDKSDAVVFLFICHLFVNSHVETFDLSDLEELFDRKRDYRKLRLSFLNRTFPAFPAGYLKSSGNVYCLTSKARKTLLSGILETEETQKTKVTENVNTISANQIVDCRNITPKTLFYNPQEREQVASLSKLLDREHFDEVQQRLSAAGMRKGFACLFYGAPGTGKTETVYQLARQTDRNVFVVNISETKSAWYGESEKRIKEVFDRYRDYAKESVQTPILLFNEADAVIGKRLENMQHSIDQTANAIQNIILQEMENLEGIMIATTNLDSNLDKAFERRFLYKIEFAKPTKETQKDIWLTLIPALKSAEASELSDSYDFSGGDIENISRKYTVENIIRDKMLTLADLHRLCGEEKMSRGGQRVKVGFL
ncbi:MAG: AAA family ATPase [Tannerella sp.]|jgi:SpoVK/Ycf46/Vps4 family AAA+-type ATPase|nr:AAA family ATPase [Tannerella sp.]